jgi:hypothetical protein
VCVIYGYFTMSGGTISGNSASLGGGVGVLGFEMPGIEVPIHGGHFNKTGGIIYGDTDANPTNGNATDNTATDDAGHTVLYIDSSIIEGGDGTFSTVYRNETLNTGDNISTDQVPSSGTGNNWTKRGAVIM